MLQVLLEDALTKVDEASFQVDSAGLAAARGQPAAVNAAEAMR